MLDLSVLPAFLVVILVFLAPPGPDMVFMLGVGLQAGRGAAVRAILGIGAGMSVYAAAVVVGLGSVVEDHPSVLTAVQVGGGLYLLWLAITTVRHARAGAAATAGSTTGRWFVRGLLVSLSNPKVILFFLAVLPRFVGEAQHVQAQLAMLGAVNVATEVTLYGAIGVCASALHGRFANRSGAQAVLSHLAAAVYLGLALLIVGEVARAA